MVISYLRIKKSEYFYNKMGEFSYLNFKILNEIKETIQNQVNLNLEVVYFEMSTLFDKYFNLLSSFLMKGLTIVSH